MALCCQRCLALAYHLGITTRTHIKLLANASRLSGGTSQRAKRFRHLFVNCAVEWYGKRVNLFEVFPKPSVQPRLVAPAVGRDVHPRAITDKAHGYRFLLLSPESREPVQRSRIRCGSICEPGSHTGDIHCTCDTCLLPEYSMGGAKRTLAWVDCALRHFPLVARHYDFRANVTQAPGHKGLPRWLNRATPTLRRQGRILPAMNASGIRPSKLPHLATSDY